MFGNHTTMIAALLAGIAALSLSIAANRTHSAQAIRTLSIQPVELTHNLFCLEAMAAECAGISFGAE